MIREKELWHFGVKGMKWGVRKKSYRSTGIRSALARRKNEKIDKSFNDWKENSKKRDNAVSLGKMRNISLREYENNKSDKALRNQYKKDNKAYKKSLRENTTYRKGQIKQQVGADLSRKYLSAAKKVKKQLDADPNNKSLQKEYNRLMSKHAVERAKARRAPEVAARRSNKKAAIKRSMTMTVKAVATTAAISVGTYAVNRYLSSHDIRLNGSSFRVKDKTIRDAMRYAKIAKDFLGYF